MPKSIFRTTALLLFSAPLLATIPPLRAAEEARKGEPTNAAEAAAQQAAAKKLEAEKRVSEAYSALVSKLSPEEQQWERVLQENLGGFYLPIHKSDKVAARSTAWDFVKDDPKLPRVLLIGDSVSRGYTQAARKALAGKANVHRAPANCGPTAAGVQKLDIWLGESQWDVIHFNFGIHDRATPLTDYQSRLESIIERLKKRGRHVIWATTTPIPNDPEKKQSAASIVERNAAAAELAKKHHLPVDDLFTAITPHLAELQNPNDVHFNPAGYEFLGLRVAESIRNVLGAP
jgi:lysophospholipase L1-like esterase